MHAQNPTTIKQQVVMHHRSCLTAICHLHQHVADTPTALRQGP
jgi:hypothetical protein